MRIATILLLLLAATYASAQPVPKSVESIDMMALNAQAAFVGRVAKVVRDGKSTISRFDITFQVAEVLKGRVEDETAVKFDLPEWQAKDWSERRPKMLVLVQTGVRQYGNFPYDLQGTPSSDVPTAKLRALRSGRQILEYTRDLLKRKPNVTSVAGFPLRAEALEARLLISPADAWWNGLVVVPVDPDLEALAKDLLRSEIISVRSHGVNALALFPSKANTAIFKALLKDPLCEVSELS